MLLVSTALVELLIARQQRVCTVQDRTTSAIQTLFLVHHGPLKLVLQVKIFFKLLLNPISYSDGNILKMLQYRVITPNQLVVMFRCVKMHVNRMPGAIVLIIPRQVYHVT